MGLVVTFFISSIVLPFVSRPVRHVLRGLTISIKEVSNLYGYLRYAKRKDESLKNSTWFHMQLKKKEIQLVIKWNANEL